MFTGGAVVYLIVVRKVIAILILGAELMFLSIIVQRDITVVQIALEHLFLLVCAPLLF